MQGSANLNIMIKAARKAGRSLVKDFREVENLQVSRKGAGDFVSRADIAAEKIIRDELMEARPNYGWLGEESEPVEGKDPTRRWIVDPLDGTTNFLNGLPHWAISIALEYKGDIVAGVIFDAAKDEMFFAEKGAGAWMNETRLRVSAKFRLSEGLFGTSIPASGRPYLPETLQDLARILPQTAGVRHHGASALDLAYVASGRFDGFWQRHLKPWDVAAGMILVREAGGLISPVDVEGDILQDGSIIASNEPIFDSFSKVVRGG
ncbi:inositol monophosphatase family protein [Rhodovulum sp. FJ3]|jgi:myo-inositol-1(or 4)-monophosphatase|uniref:inositol monophosphatase family protein n=1 Tax=Rhodovulum sp. FJ3 TaxID=3079053 RepID=UPI00293DEEC1|nr:inositol monophosphatase family protein [Rhodovulum sp. FJ3]MDV4166955.1 inositol monophosphatase family protein [Rhodovulum sp. FJ3]